jgi:hypothetical protein
VGQLIRRQIQFFGEPSVVPKLTGCVVAVLGLNGLQASGSRGDVQDLYLAEPIGSALA